MDEVGQTIGVIGPPDLVKIMLQASKEFSQHRFLDLHYTDENESVSLFKANRDKMQVCLFSGNWPYYKVKAECSEDKVDIPLVYVEESGSAIHKTIAKMLIDGVDVRRLSIDTVPVTEAKQSLGEIGLNLDHIHLMSSVALIDRDSFVSFHESLWKAGRTAAGVTFLRSAYLELKEKDVPIYRCTPSLGILREAVVKAVLEAEKLQTRSYQLVIGFAESVSTRQASDSFYREQRKNALLLQALLEFGEKTGISVVPLDGGKFGMFLTRGALQDITNYYTGFPSVREMSRFCGTGLVFGFGVGSTATLCYANATLALKYAEESGGNCAFIVFEDGRVVGPMGADQLDFRRSTISKRLILKSIDSQLSIPTLTKIQDLIYRTGSKYITPEQLAADLGISKRNARRILSRLCESGLAEVAGLDQPGTRGRPQRVYKVNLEVQDS